MNQNTTLNSILKRHSDDSFEFWLLGVLGNGIVIMGIFGNIFSIRVLSHHQMRSPPNIILIALAIADLILIAISSLLFDWTTIYPHTGRLKDYFYRYQPIIARAAFPVASIGEKLALIDTILV